jgi:hypothetical protein
MYTPWRKCLSSDRTVVSQPRTQPHLLTCCLQSTASEYSMAPGNPMTGRIAGMITAALLAGLVLPGCYVWLHQLEATSNVSVLHHHPDVNNALRAEVQRASNDLMLAKRQRRKQRLAAELAQLRREVSRPVSPLRAEPEPEPEPEPANDPGLALPNALDLVPEGSWEWKDPQSPNATGWAWVAEAQAGIMERSNKLRWDQANHVTEWRDRTNGLAASHNLEYVAVGGARTLAFYGCSYMRELMVELVRLNRRLAPTFKSKGQPGNNYDDLPEEVHIVTGGTNPSCVNNNLNVPAPGVDLKTCGLPTFRLVPELGPGVAIGFKTFLHTPDADQSFLDRLGE